MRADLKRELSFILIAIIFIVGFTSQAEGEQLVEKSQIAVQKTADTTRIVISTSGPAEFSSHWLDEPPRLIIEFHSRNIISQMDDEITVNQGVIKRIGSGYFGRGRKRSLKLLIFELTQKVPCKAWQENNTILLDIKAPLETPAFHMSSKEIFTESEANDVIIERLEAMDAALMQLAERRAPLEIPETPSGLAEAPLEIPEVSPAPLDKALMEIDKTEAKAQLPKTMVLPAVGLAVEAIEIKRQTMLGMTFWLWFAEVILILTLGFLVWRRRRLITDKEIKGLKAKLREKIVHKPTEKTSLQKKEEHQPRERQRSSILERLQERRTAPRLLLTRDFSKTITLRVESYVTHQSIKSFVNNISSNGLCFMTREEFKDKEPINLSLIFYGDMSSITSIQAHIAWKSSQEGINYYGVSFDLLEEKGKLELNRFIEARIGR